MPKDYSERRTYRKSPGRQYGYEYNPLSSRSGQSQSGEGETLQNERWSNQDGNTGKPSAVQRPDPRRTRQLLRQNILASKVRPANEFAEPIEQDEDEVYEEQEDIRMTSRRSRSGHLAQPYHPSTSDLVPHSEGDDEWGVLEPIDPERDYETQAEYAETAAEPEMRPLVRRATQTIPNRSQRLQPAPDEEEYDEDDDGYVEEAPARRRRKPRKRKVSRRGLLFGLGTVAVGGTALAAYELGPKLPKAIGDVSANIEHQLQDAFNKGLAQGAENARKEIVTALDNLEGFTLEGAVTAARLTRVAYDVFVSPIVHFGSAITGDFLNGMLQALNNAIKWLKGSYQDNATLDAIQKVLENWVTQVTLMPKQLDTITETDLDGAQAYLRALQRKIEDEKAKLNNPQPTPAPTTKPTSKPTH